MKTITSEIARFKKAQEMGWIPDNILGYYSDMMHIILEQEKMLEERERELGILRSKVTENL